MLGESKAMILLKVGASRNICTKKRSNHRLNRTHPQSIITSWQTNKKEPNSHHNVKIVLTPAAPRSSNQLVFQICYLLA